MDERSDLTEASPDEDPLEEPIWRAVNSVALPLWLAMIVAPRSRFTARLMARSGWWFAGLSGAYVAQLVATAARSGQPPSFEAADVRAALSTPRGFLTGWTHFIAFDLFVGRWIWERAVAEGRSPRLALVFTLMAGPAGLGIFGIQRRSFA